LIVVVRPHPGADVSLAGLDRLVAWHQRRRFDLETTEHLPAEDHPASGWVLLGHVGRWVHVFACRAGVALPDILVEGGATAAVGYQAPILVVWDDVTWEPALEDAVAALATTATEHLANGSPNLQHLRRALDDAALRVHDALADRDDLAMQLGSFASTLVNTVRLATSP
jgi:hypothetical protein